jgi:hypothetical protein
VSPREIAVGSIARVVVDALFLLIHCILSSERQGSADWLSAVVRLARLGGNEPHSLCVEFHTVSQSTVTCSIAYFNRVGADAGRGRGTERLKAMANRA